MKFQNENIAAILNAEVIQRSGSVVIEHICLDSRQIIFPNSALFFAIPGVRHDGHQYLSEAYQKGVRNFVVSESIAPEALPEATIFQVDHSIRALQKLAIYHRQQFSMPVIGITGSNGKTIVKEWLYQLLEKDQFIVRSPKSFNSQIGVPLSVLQIERAHELGIFEAGISQTGEMANLAPIIDCDLGIFTYIGDAHREGFHNKREKIREKLLLFKETKTLIFQEKDPDLIALIEDELPHTTPFSWSSGTKGQIQLVKWVNQQYGSQLSAQYEGKAFEAFLPFQDEASRVNAMHCLSAMLCMDIPLSEACKRLETLTTVEMRLEMITGINQCTLINDAYNADLASLDIALRFLEQQSPEKKRTLILSDLQETGRSPEELYPKVAALIREKRIDKVVGIGPEIAILKDLLPASVQQIYYPNTQNALQQWNSHTFQKETILLKGARQFQLEQIAHLLELKVHKTVLEVNLTALRNNLEVFHRLLRPDVKMLVMVKAAGYGSGAYEIARLLEFQRVDYLGVAYVDEGVELRKAGIQTPILVLNPDPSSFGIMRRYQLEPEIYNQTILEAWWQAGELNDAPGIHLKLETGMNRLGFQEEALDAMIQFLKSHPEVKVQSLFSHLAASDLSTSDSFSENQAKLFQSMVERIEKELSIQPMKHLLNSSGVIRFPEYQYDMVRLGIGIYGQESSGQLQKELQPVFSLKARISQIKQVKKGESIGYNQQGMASEDLPIGVVSIGYADGLLRLAGNSRYSLRIQGKEAPIIGNVCMDMCMVDLSQIPAAKEGDEALVFGADKSVEELAKVLQTIPYEVFTNISQRVKRVYTQE